MTSVAYVDSSALVKLVVVEVESVPMLRWYVEADRVVTSRIGVIETQRAAGRYPHDPADLRRLLASLEIIELDPRIGDQAAAVEPALLRALDAIHLATAREIGGDLEAFVTYDDRLADAARTMGLPVVRPA
ncbi:MAG: type II toxin-antitoxin system VapC family toxin [Chloroflexi bacterium]|nr:type II toxin-antitoxin system VapC family toxin [Chloroflexota bacterium]